MHINMNVIFINAIAILGISISFFKNKEKSIKILKVALKGTLNMAPAIGIIIILSGLLIGFINPEIISGLLGNQSGIFGIALASAAGAILLIPSIIAFPLTSSLVSSGASISVAAAFITTLTMIGFVTLPIEIEEMGKRLALLRNGMSFVIAIGIALIMGALIR